VLSNAIRKAAAMTVVALAISRWAGSAVAQGADAPYRVAFLAQPASCEPAWIRRIEWNRENIGKLKSLGFTVIQVDVAWTRPDDEILNIEDLVALSAEEQKDYPQPVPVRSMPGSKNLEARQETVRKRIVLAKEAGLRTLLLVGVPYNAHARYGDDPPNCILDEKTSKRHVLMLENLVKAMPGLDDLQVYTYDVDAWLCSEFGKCPRCRGVPLHRRLVGFVNTLAATWRKVKPGGRVWWEPWELSSGQSLNCIESLAPEGLGLVMHCNAAECMATMPVDRWVKNMGAIAIQRRIPVMVQYFLGGTSEETEPYFLSHPLVTLRGLQAIAAIPGLTAIKEYYGLGPDRDDPNLRMTGLFFRNAAIGENEALNELAKPYGQAADEMIRFWRLTSEGMELFPWETSWFIREIGRSRVDHSLTSATLRGMDTSTPAWRSSRHSTFLRIEPAYPPHPWMLEDVQLRCEAAARRMAQALSVGVPLQNNLPKEFSQSFALNLLDLGRFQRRALAYAYHLRETNLVTCLRAARNDAQQAVVQRLAKELQAVMAADLENVCKEKSAKVGDPNPATASTAGAWPEMEAALDLAQRDLQKFLDTIFGDAPDKASKGIFSATSR
jgi:hypothetical protein